MMIYRETVNLDNYQPKTRQSKIWLADLQLMKLDRDILLNPLGLVTDTTVSAAQKLLADQFPKFSGLQDVSKGLTMSYNILQGDFLQIINTGHKHWITVSTIGKQHPEIMVFDSVDDFLPPMAKAQIASIIIMHKAKSY